MHHQIFSRFECWQGEAEAGVTPNFLGVMTREAMLPAWMEQHAEKRFVKTDYPVFDQEYLEWIAVLEAVIAARDSFTMIELGSAWGHWLVNAAVALQRHGDLPVYLVGVEAEPTYFEWMKDHFRHNGFDPDAHNLINAAVSDRDGTAWFQIGVPEADQVRFGNAMLTTMGQVARFHLRKLWGRGWAVGRKNISLQKTRSVALNTLLQPLQRVDLLHVDVQGAEAMVLTAAAAQLDDKVQRIFVGTHSVPNEDGLRALFSGLGWAKQFDFPCGGECQTPWGQDRLVDGVQVWINPKLA